MEARPLDLHGGFLQSVRYNRTCGNMGNSFKSRHLETICQASDGLVYQPNCEDLLGYSEQELPGSPRS
eukprot:4269341-Karenia_brevis.AAC.2